MAVSEEECSSVNSRSSSSASSSSHYLSKCVLHGSVVLQVRYGHIRFPTSSDIVFGKEKSIELVIIGEDGIVQSVCEQPVFGTIKDIAVLPWNDRFRARNPQMLGKDLLVVVSDSGKLSFLSFCNEMHRFFPVTQVQLSNPGNSRNQLARMLAIDSRPELGEGEKIGWQRVEGSGENRRTESGAVGKKKGHGFSCKSFHEKGDGSESAGNSRANPFIAF